MSEGYPEDDGRERTAVTRHTALKRGAVAGGALLWAAPAVQTIGMPRAWAQVYAVSACRMTGGGRIDNPSCPVETKGPSTTSSGRTVASLLLARS